MGRLLLNTSALAIFAVGAVSAVTVISNAPAFNADLRRGNVFDQSILQLSSDMYDESRYLMQQAVSFLRADALPYEDATEDQIAAPVEVVVDRGVDAEALMRESLALSPGSAPGWAVMARASLYAGDVEEALSALRASWELAPYNVSLAQERLDLAFSLFASELPELAQDLEPEEASLLQDSDRDAILRDFETLQRYHRAPVYEFYTEELELSGLDVTLPEPPATE